MELHGNLRDQLRDKLLQLILCCWDISLSLMVALEEKSDDHQSH